MKVEKVVVFDLDDTLYQEIDFLKSAYNAIANKISKLKKVSKGCVYSDMLTWYNNKENVFKKVLEVYNVDLSVSDLLIMYRNHVPNVFLTPDRLDLLKSLVNKNIPIGILTDGRSTQQRNKIRALGLESFVKEVLISEEFGSEKPSLRNYKYFENIYGDAQYYYIADNLKKDFVTPNELNWITIRLIDHGQNIHKNKVTDFQSNYQAKYEVNSFYEIKALLEL
ncbi:HAD family hydrolase [Tamlana fucoidanivorans]|uniref:HAD family hydrolase n=1 Tax=Allotamlana fucoidanivorans TaxID=2583814 RepID=A0A5C4SQF5_9FLAO|nr:HAD family hydrolase [Tamlana fucoidanivorans]TNJ46526.1 HAD family hydrolase [Tamlana fucoidanivorans]